jgi:hypothetical protein
MDQVHETIRNYEQIEYFTQQQMQHIYFKRGGLFSPFVIRCSIKLIYLKPFKTD